MSTLDVLIQLYMNDIKNCIDVDTVKPKDTAKLKIRLTNNPIELFNTGKWYMNGTSVITKNQNIALRWFKLSADLDYVPACMKIANIYHTAAGGAWNSKCKIPTVVTRMRLNYLKKSHKYYKKAAILGNAKAQIRVAARYASGPIKSRNISKAVYWYKKAIALKNPQAMYQLGVLYYNTSSYYFMNGVYLIIHSYEIYNCVDAKDWIKNHQYPIQRYNRVFKIGVCESLIHAGLIKVLSDIVYSFILAH